MPFTSAQLVSGANYTLETYERGSPMDQITYAHPFYDFLIANKKDSLFGNGYHNEKIFVANDANYQNYFGADQVDYNERDPTRFAKYPWYNAHDGFWFDEDRLRANGIIINDQNTEGSPQAMEMERLSNVLEDSYRALKQGWQDAQAFEFLRDGSQSTKAVPGLDALISTTPNTGIVGGINAANATYWRNNADMGITANTVIDRLEIMWRNCMRYGGMVPDKIFVGAAFLDNYRKEAGLTINRQINDGGNSKGGVSLDASVSRTYFKGIELIWDPTFEALDTLLGAITYPWTKRAYMINSKTIMLRPVRGAWNVKRKPERLPDRYVHYFGRTSSYGMAINKRNANGVMSIA